MLYFDKGLLRIFCGYSSCDFKVVAAVCDQTEFPTCRTKNWLGYAQYRQLR